MYVAIHETWLGQDAVNTYDFCVVRDRDLILSLLRIVRIVLTYEAAFAIDKSHSLHIAVLMQGFKEAICALLVLRVAK